MRSFGTATAIVLIFVALTCIGFALPASALVIPLSELTGGYEYDPIVAPNMDTPHSREVDFVIPDSVTGIDDLVLRVSGQWTAGELTCSDGFGGHTVSAVLPPLTLFITSDVFPGDYFKASIETTDGTFDSASASFTAFYPPGVLQFDDLLGIDLQARLFIDFGFILSCNLTIDTYGVLDDVKLILSEPVPAKVSTWGRVKSLYR